MLTLWLLLLIQLPMMLLSGTPPEDQGFKGSMLVKRREREVEPDLPPTKEKKLSRSTDEEPQASDTGAVEERKEEVPAVLSDAPSKEKVVISVCQALKNQARDLRLLCSEEEEIPGTICGLNWNFDNITDLWEDTIIRRKKDFNRYVKTRCIDPSDTGRLVILPFIGGDMPLSVQINGRGLRLVGAVAKNSDPQGDAFTYRAFTVDDKGNIIWDAINTRPFARKENVSCFKLLSLLRRDNYVVPWNNPGDIDTCPFEYNYGIYRDYGPLKAPYDIQALRLRESKIISAVYHEISDLGAHRQHLITPSIGLLRLIQIWNAANPGKSFEHHKLEEIRGEMQDLKAEDVEKTHEILVKTCRFIHDNKGLYVDENGVFVAFSFLSILKDHESSVRNSMLTDLENRPIRPDSENEASLCTISPDKLIFFIPEGLEEVRLPFFRTIVCPVGNRRLELIGAITHDGHLLTFGIGSGPFEGEQLYEIAYYSSIGKTGIINTPMFDQENTITTLKRLVLVYRCVAERRTMRTKNARY